MKPLPALLASLILLCLPACQALDRYDRSYSLAYEGAQATVTLRPRLPLNQDIPPAYQGYAK